MSLPKFDLSMLELNMSICVIGGTKIARNIIVKNIIRALELKSIIKCNIITDSYTANAYKRIFPEYQIESEYHLGKVLNILEDRETQLSTAATNINMCNMLFRIQYLCCCSRTLKLPYIDPLVLIVEYEMNKMSNYEIQQLDRCTSGDYYNMTFILNTSNYTSTNFNFKFIILVNVDIDMIRLLYRLCCKNYEYYKFIETVNHIICAGDFAVLVDGLVYRYL